MTRLTGPCLSFDGSATIGKVLVFSKWKGRNYARLRVKPYNPKSAYQTGIRETMTWGVLYYTKGAYLTASKRTWWNTYGDQESEPVTGLNRFLRFFVALNYDGDTGTFIYGGIPNPQ